MKDLKEVRKGDKLKDPPPPKKKTWNPISHF